MVSLINNLGGEAGFGEQFLARNDDGSTSAVDITSIFAEGINFFGTTYTSLFINNNGSVTFEQPRSTFTPDVITGVSNNPEISPFFGDVDTRLPAGVSENGPGTVTTTPGGTSQGTDLVWYDLDTDNNRLVVTWDDVGYFNQSVNKLNAFQLILTAFGQDDFDIEFRYEAINWTTGGASGGVDGLGGTVARAGYTSGNGEDFFELPASGIEEEILSLENDPGNTGEDGIWRFVVRGGEVDNFSDELEGTSGNDALRGGDGFDTLRGYGGNDLLYGNVSEDVLYGNAGNDVLFGGQQDDLLYGGQGDDLLFGGGGNDVFYGNLGVDTLFGGAGDDQFVIGDDIDIIADFSLEDDRIVAGDLNLPELFRLITSTADGHAMVLTPEGGGFIIQNLAFSDANILLFI